MHGIHENSKKFQSQFMVFSEEKRYKYSYYSRNYQINSIALKTCTPRLPLKPIKSDLGAQMCLKLN